MNKLKVLRTSMRLTQLQLAEQLGISQQTIARWETGTNQPPTKYLRDLAVLFGGDVGDFVNGTRLKKKKNPSEVEYTDGDILFGSVQLNFNQSTDLEDGRYAYPITVGEYSRICDQIQECNEFAQAQRWLKFHTLDRRWILANVSYITAVDFSHDDVTAPPYYEHLEVYQAALNFARNSFPSDEEVESEDFEYSRALVERARKLHVHYGGSEATLKALEGIYAESGFGAVRKVFPEDEALLNLVTTFSNVELTENTFIDLISEGHHRSNFVRLGATRLIEIPEGRLQEALARGA